MPRSGSTPFNFSYPAGTVAVSGQPISSVAYNASLTDMTNNVFNAAWPITYGGTGTTDGSSLVPDGSAATPGFRFQSEPTSGFYRVAAGTVGLSVLGVGEVQWTATAYSPITSDGSALGTTTKMWGDLFLASGGVINWNNGDVTVTHSANALAFAGASSGYTFDALVTPSSIATTGVTGGGQGAGTVNAAQYYIAGAAFGRPTLATAQATTSGTSIDFTSIPSWATVIRLYLVGVSTNGTDGKVIQIGSGSVTTSGYIGSNGFFGTSTTSATLSTGLGIRSLLAADTVSGIVEIALVDSVTHTYVMTCTASANTNFVFASAASIALSGALDRVRLTTAAGTNTFDAGLASVAYF